ncbi:MAG: hypothetical protein M1600_01360 [Firmicutes bacterium]|nr:hypothetical protein [Bacillota bacterium]
MAKTLRQITREQFQEEVARELGIDLSQADHVKPPNPRQDNGIGKCSESAQEDE